MTQFVLESRWITAEGIPGVSYRFSDLVRIKSGEYSPDKETLLRI